MNIKEAIEEGKILQVWNKDYYNCVYCGKMMVTSDYGIYCSNKKCKNFDKVYFAEEGDIKMKKKDIVRISYNISGIEEVQIGLDTARLNLEYEDTGNLVEDQDFAYKISIPTAIDEDVIYFEEYENARDYLKDFE